QQVGETPALAPVLYGLWRFYTGRLPLHTPRAIGGTLLGPAQQDHHPRLAAITHNVLGGTRLYPGGLSAARRHPEAGLARYPPALRQAPAFRIGHDPGVACRVHAALTLWLLGYPAQALGHIHAALTLAHALRHPSSLAFAQRWAAHVSQLR